MALYGDVETVKAMLRPSEGAAFRPDAEARLDALRGAVSAALEEKTGRVFGGTAAPATRTVDGRFRGQDDVLELPSPVRSVTAVAIVGDYPAALLPTDWALWWGDGEGNYHALRRLRGATWPGRDGVNRVQVTAYWSDEAAGGDVPADVTYAANYLIAESFKAEQASPAGFTGPDGATVPIRNPWKHELVQTVIGKYRADLALLAF